jgi:NTP pyrophosphatase (non-canonical NTP hydrolase)
MDKSLGSYEMNKLQELLTITMEECGELIQQCSKVIRCDDYYDNKKLTEEVGDVMCMIELLHEYDLISWTDVDDRVLVKKNKLKKWSGLIDE